MAHPEGEETPVEPSPATGDENERFVVVTPDRELISLGTKFDVRAGSDGTSVAVTQGKVRVSGVDEPLEAGQQLPADEDATAVPIGQTFHLIDWTRDLVTAYESPDCAGQQLLGRSARRKASGRAGSQPEHAKIQGRRAYRGRLRPNDDRPDLLQP